MTKNICLIIDSLNGGGAERVVLVLATALSELGHHVDVIVLNDKIDYPLDSINFSVHVLDKQRHFIRFIRLAKRVNALQTKIREIGIKFDLFIANLPNAATVCKQAKLPNLYFCIHHTVSIKVLSRYKNSTGFTKLRRKIKHPFLTKKLYKNQNLITVSQGVKKDLLNFGIRPKTVQTIYNPFDFKYIKQQATVYTVTEKNYIIHVGRFDALSKRHDILIQAYKKSNIKQKLLLFGDYDNVTGRKIQKLVIDLGLQDKVIFKGFNPNPFPYIKYAKVLVLSSDFEGFGMVLVESLILETPVVSTNCLSGPREILVDELKPFLSPVGDVEALAKNIKRMVENPVLITDKFISKFGIEKSVKQYLKLCD